MSNYRSFSNFVEYYRWSVDSIVIIQIAGTGILAGNYYFYFIIEKIILILIFKRIRKIKLDNVILSKI